MIHGTLILRYRKICCRCFLVSFFGESVTVIQTKNGNRRHYCRSCAEIIVEKGQIKQAKFGQLNKGT